ncbi:MAG: CpaF family protein [Microthrixaceae bacterium]
MPVEEALSRVAVRFKAERSPLADPAQRVRELLAEEAPLLDAGEVAGYTHRLVGDLVGLGALEQLLADDSVTDVLVDGPGPVWVERHGQLERSAVSVERSAIDAAIERIVAPLGLRADRSHPIVDARRPDGTRVAVVLPPVAPDGPVLALRRHRSVAMGLAAFGSSEVVDLVRSLLVRGLNIVVHGATGSGKTTLVAAMCSCVDPATRIVVIEDTAELRFEAPSVVRLEARPGTAEGAGRVEMRQLVRASLRLRPDRLVVGEVRGAEAADMIWALSTGHRGSMSTVHAAGAADALARLEVMVALGLGGSVSSSTIATQVRSAVDVLVGVERSTRGERRIGSVHLVEPDGLCQLHPETHIASPLS